MQNIKRKTNEINFIGSLSTESNSRILVVFIQEKLHKLLTVRDSLTARKSLVFIHFNVTAANVLKVGCNVLHFARLA